MAFHGVRGYEEGARHGRYTCTYPDGPTIATLCPASALMFTPLSTWANQEKFRSQAPANIHLPTRCSTTVSCGRGLDLAAIVVGKVNIAQFNCHPILKISSALLPAAVLRSSILAAVKQLMRVGCAQRHVPVDQQRLGPHNVKEGVHVHQRPTELPVRRGHLSARCCFSAIPAACPGNWLYLTPFVLCIASATTPMSSNHKWAAKTAKLPTHFLHSHLLPAQDFGAVCCADLAMLCGDAPPDPPPFLSDARLAGTSEVCHYEGAVACL